MTTFDEVLVKSSNDFMDKAKQAGKPFFVWHNTTRMHVWTFLSAKYRAMQNSKTNYGLEEAGMAQMDDSIGDLLKHLDDIGEAENTIVISGYHDATGNAQQNADIAKQRAMNVRDAIKAGGVADDRFDLQKPAVTEGSGDNKEARRVEVSVK